MAIAFNATNSKNDSTIAVLTQTWSHTCTGSNRLLFVGVSFDSAGLSISSVTYAGTNLTLIRTDENTAISRSSSIWYLVAPATGANDIVVTYSNDTVCISGSISLTGVAQTGSLDANNGAIGVDITASVVVTTVADNAWVLDTMAANSSFGWTVGAGQTQRWNVIPSASVDGGGSTEGPKTPAGAVTMSWSVGQPGGTDWAISAASFAPAVAGGATHPGWMADRGWF